jgi:hypothetical protein|tara:strand:+ start:9985 stop:10179 length:195 start_codon:yes stop_codon:yes gene_type:complete
MRINVGDRVIVCGQEPGMPDYEEGTVTERDIGIVVVLWDRTGEQKEILEDIRLTPDLWIQRNQD